MPLKDYWFSDYSSPRDRASSLSLGESEMSLIQEPEPSSMTAGVPAVSGGTKASDMFADLQAGAKFALPTILGGGAGRPRIVSLLGAIKQVESGGDYSKKGKQQEFGAYQFRPTTWLNESRRYMEEMGLQEPLDPKNPMHQDILAGWIVKRLVDEGRTPEQIFSYWNSGDFEWEGKKGINSAGIPFDTEGYVSNALPIFNSLESGQRTSIFKQMAGGGPQDETRFPVSESAQLPLVGSSPEIKKPEESEFVKFLRMGLASVKEPEKPSKLLAVGQALAEIGAGLNPKDPYAQGLVNRYEEDAERRRVAKKEFEVAQTLSAILGDKKAVITPGAVSAALQQFGAVTDIGGKMSDADLKRLQAKGLEAEIPGGTAVSMKGAEQAAISERVGESAYRRSLRLQGAEYAHRGEEMASKEISDMAKMFYGKTIEIELEGMKQGNRIALLTAKLEAGDAVEKAKAKESVQKYAQSTLMRIGNLAKQTTVEAILSGLNAEYRTKMRGAEGVDAETLRNNIIDSMMRDLWGMQDRVGLEHTPDPRPGKLAPPTSQAPVGTAPGTDVVGDALREFENE